MPQPDLGPQPITRKVFALFQALILREAGISLSENKKSLLVGRLARRLRELGLHSYADYYKHVLERDDELVRMLDAICTNETHFFREPRQFEFLERQVLPQWTAAAGRRARRVRVWSAGCSTGEEPYSLAMVLLAHFPPGSGWELEILATDLSTKVLERAKQGVWALEKASEIPPAFLKAFMLRGTASQEGRMKAGPELRSIVRFQRLNLNDPFYPALGSFDLVFCRNVLIYFNAASKTRVIHRLLEHLEPSGYLFLGHAESLSNLSERVRSVVPTVYVHARRGEARTRAGAPFLPSRAEQNRS